jgi:thiamine biosynthesis lipoprotein
MSGIRAACVAFLILHSQFLIACERAGGEPVAVSSPRLIERAKLAMGSELRLSAWTVDEPRAISAFDEVFFEFERLENMMSVWRPGSEVIRLNQAAGVHPEPVSQEVREVLRLSRDASDLTEGKFDITFGALADLWKFDHDQDNRIPDPAAVRARLPLIDYKAIVVNDSAGTAFIAHKGMRVHLGGIGKGYAVDRGVEILRRRGLNDFMIQAGGDLYVSGRKGDRAWRLAIQDPRGPANHTFATLELSNGTFSTSGDYERSFLQNGVRYHHILDPDTGEPARACRSVTLVTGRAVLADALAKGVFILGPVKGMALIERLPEVEGVIVSAANEVLVSSGLKDRLTLIARPTEGP